MVFVPTPYEDRPSTATPMNAENLIESEENIATYAESVAAGGIELGSASITGNVATASSSYVDVAGLTTTVTVGTRPIMVSCSVGSAANSASVGGVSIAIVEDGTVLGAMGTTLNITVGLVSCTRFFRRAPSAGSHTYKVQHKAPLGGTATLYADSGGSSGVGPATLTVVEI